MSGIQSGRHGHVRIQEGAAYEEIQAWVREKYGFYATHLNIAKTKQKCGIIERQNYNLPKSEDTRSPETLKEKEEAVIDAFRKHGDGPFVSVPVFHF